MTYIYIEPLVDNDGRVDDFDISVYTQTEPDTPRGTIIERIDDSSGIMTSIQALIGTAYIDRYVGNVSGVDIRYNGHTRNAPILQYGKIPTPYGDISLGQNNDQRERLTSK